MARCLQPNNLSPVDRACRTWRGVWSVNRCRISGSLFAFVALNLKLRNVDCRDPYGTKTCDGQMQMYCRVPAALFSRKKKAR